METVQKLVPYFQELLQQWYELTLHNQEYAICLAVSVWLITAIFYSIRIGFLKRSNAKLLKDKTATQTSLDETKKELQTLQQQYTEANERMEQAVEKSAAESQRLQASNKQLANSLSSMVDCFELNQHNLPTAESENLLTEYEAVVARALERFQTEQQAKTQLQLSFHAETAKLAEKEMLVSSLQNRLDTQTQQLAKLELAIEHYEDAQRQLEADKQQLGTGIGKTKYSGYSQSGTSRIG
jgi:DNA repair exonuclease SbcCD ATPase subunit